MAARTTEHGCPRTLEGHALELSAHGLVFRGTSHASNRGMKVPKLSHEEVKTRLHDLPGWTLREGKIHREYKFTGFAEAFGFMSTCALVAQKQDHHPEWFNVFNRVVVDLTTDDAGGISELDFALAVEMEKAAPLPAA